jgi:ferredoxin
MANPNLRLAENAAGEFFVDSTCIDCDTCRKIASATFRDHGDQSSVYRQPESEEELQLANMALVACPTGSIGAGHLLNAKLGVDSFPLEKGVGTKASSFFGENLYSPGTLGYLKDLDRKRLGRVTITRDEVERFTF